MSAGSGTLGPIIPLELRQTIPLRLESGSRVTRIVPYTKGRAEECGLLIALGRVLFITILVR